MVVSLICFDDKHISVTKAIMGCKLDLALISASVERWRPKTHTFHLSCGECTITLENVVLQLGLPVDEPVIMGSAIVSSKVGLCISLLGKVLDKFEGDVSSHSIECDINQWLPSSTVVVSLVATTISTSQGGTMSQATWDCPRS
ncbi:hypothetical protein PVK06_023939 [Gossypium arboreum]|uniref:Aminotransferase-like plant mobile domain-containing protein n=1 Tax=Gossypium arboreum TaxID=29729 RepID=A0ABR0PCK3_GOSAR|nr:hypothetical protein PVK06_023939 [Gossypium arboreum]